ncbi:hypothetical protein GCM10018952_34280 [Streptosporangium vulgare]
MIPVKPSMARMRSSTARDLTDLLATLIGFPPGPAGHRLGVGVQGGQVEDGEGGIQVRCGPVVALAVVHVRRITRLQRI